MTVAKKQVTQAQCMCHVSPFVIECKVRNSSKMVSVQKKKSVTCNVIFPQRCSISISYCAFFIGIGNVDINNAISQEVA